MEEIRLNTYNVVKSILKHLQAKRPLSVIRLGDGEAIMFQKNSSLELCNMIRNNIGYVPSERDINIIRQNLALAIDHSDIIGIPTPEHYNLGFYWREVDKMVRFLPPSKKANFCSINLHWDLLDTGMIKKVLQASPEIYIVSARPLDEEIKRNFNVLKVNSFLIAPQLKFSPDHVGEPHYPDQYWKVQEWINGRDLRGKLCLVGAGFIGKIYLKWFKDAGGVALDLGSVFDFWAGLKTRGKGKGVGVKWDKYKLK
jgi:hypothetical protein